MMLPIMENHMEMEHEMEAGVYTGDGDLGA